MSRIIVGVLKAWDAAAQRVVALEPGLVLDSCQVRFEEPGAYMVEFRARGNTYRCPLYAFQPRTEPLADVPE